MIKNLYLNPSFDSQPVEFTDISFKYYMVEDFLQKFGFEVQKPV